MRNEKPMRFFSKMKGFAAEKCAALGLEWTRFARRALLSRVRSTDREGSHGKPLGGGTRPKEKQRKYNSKTKVGTIFA